MDKCYVSKRNFYTMQELQSNVLYANDNKLSYIKSMIYKIFLRGFQFLCVGFTIFVYYLCIKRYTSQKDSSTVDYQWYHQEEKDIYPTISTCFYGTHVVFSTEKLKKVNRNFDADLYSKFLQGQYWNDEMAKIMYDEVSLEILDYVDQLSIIQTDGTIRNWSRNQMYSMTRY